jgi:Fic family protein
MLSDHIVQLLERVDKGLAVIARNRPLPQVILKKLHKQLVVDWTYNSNAIEGNTLSLYETRLVLEDGLTIGRKSLREHLETINHKEAIAFVEKLAGTANENITERNIREIHALVLKGIDSEYAGRYRDIQVRISGSPHVPPEPLLVNDLMKNMLQVVDENDHSVIQAAKAHFELTSIHPFVDGNGRTARLLMNLILMRNGYVPAVILKNDRKQYYRALEKGHAGQLDELIILIGRALERTIYLYLEAIPGHDMKLLTLAEAAKESPYSKDYLNVMARRGVIPAIKIRRNWMITREALLLYVQTHRKKE